MEIDVKDLIVIDCEASSLHKHDSYPIEVGVAMAKDSFDCLIKPVAIWHDWDKKSEEIHGISQATLLNEGLDIITVVEMLNSRLNGKTLISDNEAYENMWINRLYKAAGYIPSFRIISMYSLDFDFDRFKEKRDELVAYIPLHRALNDAYIIRESILHAIS